ncbi:MAG: flagellar basal body rod protein FlgB [Gammaproteobacteria bacterium]|nr:flagellar basal body rod protein FlgB [Gammaproteobacteria bacterium]
MPISFEKAFSIHDDAMVMRARRSSLLASNIANADTPNYKARDIDFRAVLHSMQSPQTGGKLVLTGTHQNHLSGTNTKMDVDVQYRNPLHAALDGNTVDSHVEQARFTENAIQYQASFTLLNGRISGIVSALRGE